MMRTKRLMRSFEVDSVRDVLEEGAEKILLVDSWN
jgi:hypothetical protein